MDPPTTSLDSSDPQEVEEQRTFATKFDSPVAAHLAPTNLPLNKVQRAWDRRPQSPFSRKKVRFGKVWKRNTAPSTDATSMFAGSYALEAMRVESPGKAVKKMRVDYGQVVSDWDRRGSPNRRIVTRSSRVAELVALDEEESQEQDGQAEEEEALRVEVVGEDGAVQEIGADEELQQDEWEDESVTEEHVWDATLMHLGEAPGARTTRENEQIEVENSANMVATTDVVENKAFEPSQGDHQEEPATQIVVSADAGPGPAVSIQTKSSLQAPVLPEGFVSPVKERRRRPISQVKQALANRRRTLPVNFSAAPAQPTANTDMIVVQDSPGHAERQTATEQLVRSEQAQQQCFSPLHRRDESGASTMEATIDATEDTEEDSGKEETSNENEWEDVEEENELGAPDAPRDMTPEPIAQAEWIDTVENTPTSPQAEANAFDRSFAAEVHDRVADLVSPSKLPSSPVPSITGQHPRLPLRRSPRRQSTSPLKRSTIAPLGKSHLIAFTPVKLPVSQSSTQEPCLASSPLPTSPALLQNADSPQTSMPTLTRSSSAPPEEPQMSPRKPGQPRLSDDTALLQAFINRASESKNGRRTSATARRESLENRRNSDAVRQALASPAVKPAATDVLGDLDPNSPSPRKQAAVECSIKPLQQEEQDELAQSSPARTVSRRSGRSKKKPETLSAATYSGPNKISIRGSADSVVLKKTEAQELAQATRSNTKKNKGGAVLPPLRLTRMAKEAALNDGNDVPEVAMEEGDANKKGIKWAETLATFYEGASEPEISMMIDELSVPEPGAGNESSRPDTEMTGLSAPTPASETPSKPRQRRLKPTRMASTPAQATRSTQASVEEEPAKETKAKPMVRKRSRIATPAKPRGTTAASTSEAAVDEVKVEPKKTAAARKAASKLPAPTVSAIPAAQGKENSVIASPPKKRAKAPATPALGSAALAKNSQPKLDFSKGVGLEKKHAESGNGAVPGIASPAKRSARTSVLLGEDGSVTKKELPPSLGSPAKKRTRRTPA
ncbi:hypothetical protein M409DRAFT_57561 [Zasmidium cellare ATCC 36951]|uniref:Uncharacterized protein n=1 Tax=Zasmidium cellare ATCC 36951 TaxID=1080233 RepID=A0A6A6CAK8_ZASCE|nr:uncharacterized protein M409DRAFT_57561 [Zasmidium cellare ATCC 36951]KAF2163268.1 hypothetical protein M409DRAFT_57561 [Zasmidium cellare ATCC 36951]